MKQIINSKKYDTETATLLHDYWNGLGQGDFGHFNEALYITKKGEFFLAGSGGPKTKYGNEVGKWLIKERITCLSKDEALAWAEKHIMPADDMEKYFNIEEA